MEVSVIDQNLKPVAKVALSEDASEKVNKAVIYYGIKALRNNLRHGTVKVKSRGEVKRTTKKLYRQKGTGNARHGSKRANIFVGGGNVHGPQPRSYNEKINKKFKNKCYQEIFKYLLQNNGVHVVSDLSFDKPSTKTAAQFLQNLKLQKALLVLPYDERYQNVALSFRNLKDVKVVAEHNINFFDLLKYENVILLQPGFETLKERYSL